MRPVRPRCRCLTRKSRFVTEYATTAQIHDNYTLKPNLVNQFSVSFSRMYIPLGNPTAGGNYPDEGGDHGPAARNRQFGDAGHQFHRHQCADQLGGNQCARQSPKRPTPSTCRTTCCGPRGKHFITVGFQFQALQDNYNNPLTGTLASFSFSNNETAKFAPTGTLVTTTGLSYASYLLGAGGQQQRDAERRRGNRRPL